MNLASLVDYNLREFGEYPATFFDGRWMTNREGAERTFRLANALRSLPIAAGDRVVVLLANCPEVLQSYGGILRAGGVIVPVLFLLAAEELRLILNDSAAKAIITSPDFVSKCLDARAGLDPEPRVIVVGDGPEETLSFEELLAPESPEAPVVEREANEPALFMYTSGTTGRPKGVVLTHSNMLHQAEAVNEISDFDREDISLAALPMAHAGGLVGWVIGQKIGARGVVLPWFDPDLFCRSIQEHKVAGTSLVPTMGTLLLNYPGLESYDLTSLEQVAFGASPVPAELLRAFEERFGCKTRVVYGLTEAAPIVTAERLSDERREGSCGRAIPGVEIAILDPDGERPLPPGESGEICVRGPNVMAGYHNMPEETARALRGGWLHTGDIGYLDEDGFLFVIDRVKDMIIRGGLNVYPRDVEEALFSHPAVADVAVVGVPDAVYGEEVEAFVVKSYGTEVTQDELLTFARGRLAKYKSPKRITFMGDLPKNQVGKVLKRALREIAAKREG